MMIHYIIILFALLFSLNLYAQNAKHGHEGHREHQAHVHGLAEMTFAQVGQKVEINLESPSANIVGFEHKASTEKQENAVIKVKTLLESPQQLFIFNGTRCDIAKTTVDVSSLLSHHEEEHEKRYDDKHVKTHSEITANYQFTCKHGSKLKTVSVELLAKFPGIKKLETQ